MTVRRSEANADTFSEKIIEMFYYSLDTKRHQNQKISVKIKRLSKNL